MTHVWQPDSLVLNLCLEISIEIFPGLIVLFERFARFDVLAPRPY